MIDLSVLTKSLETLMRASAALSMQSVTIKRGERINFDPGVCPWLGIYPGMVDTKPKSLGQGSARWNNAAELQVVIQTASFNNDGQAASDQLETLISTVLAVVDADLTLAVSGARVVGVHREYKYVVFDSDESGNIFMPQTILKLSIEMRSA